MLEHDLDAVALRRVLVLRQTALLRDVALSELATLAGNAVEVALPAGARVAVAGQRVLAVHVVVDGCLATAGDTQRWTRQDVFGAIPIFADRPARHGVRAVVPTRTLQIAGDDLIDLLEDNFDVLFAAIRGLAGLLVGRRGVVAEVAPMTIGVPLGLVDRLFLMRRQAPFARGNVRALASLADAATEQRWPAGAVIAREGEPATSAWWIGTGEVRLVAGGREVARRGAGAAVGLLEMLAVGRHGATLEAVTDTQVLSTTATALIDVLEDHAELGIDVVTALSHELLDRDVET